MLRFWLSGVVPWMLGFGRGAQFFQLGNSILPAEDWAQLDECDRLKDWPWLLSPLVSFKGFEWHLGLFPVLVWRLHIRELQEDAIWRAHLQVRGWAFWGKLFFIDSCLGKLGVLWTVNDLNIVIPLKLLLRICFVCVSPVFCVKACVLLMQEAAAA